MFIPKGIGNKSVAEAACKHLEHGEEAIALMQIGMTHYLLTDQQLAELKLDNSIKESIYLSDVVDFRFDSNMMGKKMIVETIDGEIKLGSVTEKESEQFETLLRKAIATHKGETPSNVSKSQSEKDVAPAKEASNSNEMQPGSTDKFKTNRKSQIPDSLKKIISRHRSSQESIRMVITPDFQSHAGALVVQDTFCFIVKGGFWGGLMSGSLGGERVANFYFTEITGIEFNSGWVNGVLEILTSSYQGTANKDFWKGSLKSRNADSNDPWTLSNTLPMTKSDYEESKELIDELRKMVADARNPKPVVTSSEAASLDVQLSKLASLKEQGLLSDEEFQSAKRKLLD